jgi:hypothetical protein
MTENELLEAAQEAAKDRSEAAVAILATVLVAVDAVDKRWVGKQLPGTPSITDYAAEARARLRQYEEL